MTNDTLLYLSFERRKEWEPVGRDSLWDIKREFKACNNKKT